jgi:hypothetical protein
MTEAHPPHESGSVTPMSAAPSASLVPGDPARTRRWLFIGGAVIFALIALAHLALILNYAVDLPTGDEWDQIIPGTIDRWLDFSKLFIQHNEHRIVLVRIMFWLEYLATGLDFRVAVALNFVVYLAIPLAFLRIAALQKDGRQWLLWPILWLLLTPYDQENHRWAFQIAWHLNLLMLVVAAILWFHPQPSRSKFAWGLVCLCVALGSMASGVVTSIVLVGLLVLDRARVWLTQQAQRKRAEQEVMVSVVLIGGTLAVWFIGYHHPPGHPPTVWPDQRVFWQYLLTSLSVAFGNGHELIDGNKRMPVAALFYLGAVVLPLAIQTWRVGRGAKDPTLAIRWAILVATGAGCAAITMGRAGFGVGQALAPRYYETVLPLLPIAALSWMALPRRWLGTLAVVGLFLVTAVVGASFWDRKPYEEPYVRNREAEECARSYYHAHTPAVCPTTYPVSIANRLDYAKLMGMHFAKRLSE